jgi:hypothetical protein
MTALSAPTIAAILLRVIAVPAFPLGYNDPDSVADQGVQAMTNRRVHLHNHARH